MADQSTLEWRSCDVASGAECATVQVPLDWDMPDGEQISISIARTKAEGRRLGSILINPGGPGGSGLELLSSSPMTPAITEHFDIVSWDPRGVGESTRLECDSGVAHFLSLDSDPDSDQEQQALDSAAERISTDCGEKSPGLVRNMTTADTVRDLEAIRVALGSEKLNYLGYSYGTDIGQHYAQRYPDKVASMVLDGIVDTAQGFREFLLGQTTAFEKALAEQARRCEDNGRSVCGVKNLIAAYDDVHEMVEAEPLRVNSRRLGPAELAIATFATAYWPDGWSDLGPALANALDGDGTQLLGLADSYVSLSGYIPYAAVVCSDSPTPRGSEEYLAFAREAEAISPRLGSAIANELLPCATWPARSELQVEPVTETGPTPILVIGNTGDPATPYENAKRVAERITNGILVTVETDGHTAFGSNRCATELVERYFISDEVPDPGQVCE